MRYEEEELQNIRYWKAVFSGIGSVGSILASIASWQHQAGLPAVSPIDWESVSGNVINSAEVRKEVLLVSVHLWCDQLIICETSSKGYKRWKKNY